MKRSSLSSSSAEKASPILGPQEGAGKRRVVYLRASPTLGRNQGWRTLKSLALSPLPSALLLPLTQPGLGEKFQRGAGGAEVVAMGRGESGVPSPSSGTRRFGRYPRSSLAFASSPIYFPFLLRTAPERQLCRESVPPPHPRPAPSPARFSLPDSWGGAREGAEVGRNVSERLGLETEFSLWSPLRPRVKIFLLLGKKHST